MADIKTIEKLIAKPGALIINTYPNKQVFDCVQKEINRITSQGEHVLILRGASYQSIVNLSRNDNAFLKEVYTTEPFRHGFGHQCSIYDLITIIKDNSHDNWINKLKMVLIESGEDVFYEPNIWETGFYLLQDKLVALGVENFPKLLVLVKPRHSIEPALKETLPLFDSKLINETQLWRETYFNLSSNEVKKNWWTVWSSCDGDAYFNTLVPNNQSNQSVGIIAPLAQFAGRWGVERHNNLAIYTHQSGEKDRLENLSSHFNQVMYKMQGHIGWQFFRDYEDFSGALTVYNNNGNPWLTLKNLAYVCQDLTISNVIAKQTMMLEYFLANAHCFATVPITPLSPKIKRNSAYNTVLVLLQRLKHSQQLSLISIGYLLNKIDTQQVDNQLFKHDVFGNFQQLVSKFFGHIVAQQLKLDFCEIWNDEKKRYLNQAFVSIDEGYLHNSIEWLQPVQIRDGNNHFVTILKDHIYQTYWVGKQVLFFGKVFVVDSIDTFNNIININHSKDTRLLDYRLDKHIKITHPKKQWSKVSSMSREISFAESTLILDSYVLDFSIHCGHEIVCNDSMWRNPSFTIKSDNQFIRRDYKFGRALRIRLLNSNHESLLTDQSAIALSAWLNESVVTLLPEISPYFVSAPELIDSDNRPTDKVTNICIPDISVQADDIDKTSCIWIVEDSHTDLGIINTYYENFIDILDICYDWLEWFLIDSSVASTGIEQKSKTVCLENISYPSHNWFGYGNSRVDNSIDLNGLKTSIVALFGSTYKFKNTSRRRRVEKNSHKYKLIDNETSLIYECDICRSVIDDNQPNYVLSDGRISCEHCYNIGITDVSAIEAIYHSLIKAFYKTQHNIKTFSNLKIRLVDQTEISQQQQTTFIPTSRFDSRSIGLAVSKGIIDSATVLEGSKYIVMLESGHSIESTAVTLVHELCHIWQYEHSNYQKLQRQYGKHIIEGHAVWTEVSFLNYLDEHPYAEFNTEALEAVKRDNQFLRESNDVYGKGYRLLKSKLGAKDASAFNWITKHFAKG